MPDVLQSKPVNLRAAGILLHPTSLPGAHGIGDLGQGARQFVDWLADAGLTLWQVLPLVPPGAADSPYASPSAFSGNPWLIDLQGLVDDGLLDADDLPRPLPEARVDFAAVHGVKKPLLERAADRLVETPRHPLHAALRAYAKAETWAQDAGLFHALRDRGQGTPWWDWPLDIRNREPTALAWWRQELASAVDRYVALQFLFDRQWQALRAYARERNVRLIGDAPIYVDADSADTWCHRALFQLDPAGRALAVAGVPPDYFSETGQLWGNPLYDWQAMARDGYRWWIARLQRALAQTDLVRIDHFRGFSAYWAVPAGSQDARTGRWQPGPGLPMFQALRKGLGGLPLIAEDLGVVDDALVALRDGAGLPGMRVLQFAFGGDSANLFLPHHHEPHSVVYTGTHDNDTTAGWWQHAVGVQDHTRRYLGVDGRDIAWDFIRTALASVCRTAIVPMQDVLSLGSEARMNTPGVAVGNWGWRVPQDAFRPELAARLRELVLLYDRVPGGKPV
jgi:4-alpha-glucanotransferase